MARLWIAKIWQKFCEITVLFLDHLPPLMRRKARSTLNAVWASSLVNDSSSVVVADSCSLFFPGHGFKLGPVSGKILAQLAMDETPSYDMSPFKITRFKFGQHKASLWYKDWACLRCQWRSWWWWEFLVLCNLNRGQKKC